MNIIRSDIKHEKVHMTYIGNKIRKSSVKWFRYVPRISKFALVKTCKGIETNKARVRK